MKKGNDMMNETTTKSEDQIPEHEVHAAAQDLLRAEKHRNNPGLMKKVHEHLSDQKNHISSIQDLSKLRNKMMTEPKEEMSENVDASPKMPKEKMPLMPKMPKPKMSM